MPQQNHANPILNGSAIPAFTLTDKLGRRVSLDELTKENGVVVAFIHGTFCPYCMVQLQRLNTLAPELNRLKVGLVCVSHDRLDTIFGYEVSAQPRLQYPLLADSEPTLATKFGIEDTRYSAPYPAVFYADKDGKVHYSDVSSDPDCAPNMSRMVEVIKFGAEGPQI